MWLYVLQSSAVWGLSRGLSQIFMVSMPDDALGQWLEHSLCYLVDTVDPSRSCGETVLAKLAEVLFVETLRCYITLPSSGQTGWLAGLSMNLIDIVPPTNAPYLLMFKG